MTPDHLDYMASLDEYYASKMNIYMNQDENDYFIENIDDPTLKEYLVQLHDIDNEFQSVSQPSVFYTM